MKKKVFIICILIILAVSAVTYFTFQRQYEQNRDYEVEKITDYKYFISRAANEQKFGVIDVQGNVILPEEYDMVAIPNPSKPVFICKQDDRNIAKNELGEQIYTQYENVEALQLKNVATDVPYEKSVIKYEKNGKYGLLNLAGETVTDAIYEEIDTLQYKEGELLVKKDGKYGLINYHGATLVNTEYDQISADTFFDENTQYRYDGYIVANKTDNGYRYGYISCAGEMYLDTKYNDMQRILDVGDKDEAYLLVAENGKYGLYKNDKQVIENQYQSISLDNDNSIFIVQQGKKYGALTIEGKKLIDCKFEQLDVKGKYLYAQNGETAEVYDKEGKLTNISPNTTVIDIPEKEGYTIHVETTEENTTYQIYKNDQPVSEETYQYIAYLQKDLCIASKTGENLGIIDMQGLPKSEFKYTTIQVIPNTNLIQKATDEETEILDEEGKSIIQMKNATLMQEDEYLCLSDGNNNQYVTFDGKVVTNKEVFANNTLFATQENGKWGFSDSSGKMVVEAIYDKVTEFNKYGFAGVLKDGKWGMIKQDGTVGLEPNESNLTFEAEPDFIGVYHRVQYSSAQIYYVK